MANGIADNMLITTYLSMKAPVFVAPAMDLDMYQHPTTQQNLERLRSFGNYIIEPGSGFLASGLEGKGRMEEPEQIIDYLDKALNPRPSTLNPRHILITAGPTYEKIDPVRFIGNYSSGKMGFALAEECARRGMDVTLIAGPVSITLSPEFCTTNKHAQDRKDSPKGESLVGTIHRIDVESCEEMYNAAIAAFPSCDDAILCAAVADFRPETVADEKIKRKGDDLVIRLKPTHDIAAALGKMKRDGQHIVAFALETNNEENNAMQKLQKKNADFIVLNSTRIPGTTFQSDDNQISILSATGKKDFAKKPKTEVARDIIDELLLIGES